MRQQALLAHLDKHRPRVGELYSHLLVSNYPEEVKKFVTTVERLFEAYWKAERQLWDCFCYSCVPLGRARRSRMATDNYITHLSGLLKINLIDQARFDIIVTPLLEVPSYRIDIMFILGKINPLKRK